MNHFAKILITMCLLLTTSGLYADKTAIDVAKSVAHVKKIITGIDVEN